jgi:hypothetical protein
MARQASQQPRSTRRCRGVRLRSRAPPNPRRPSPAPRGPACLPVRDWEAALGSQSVKQPLSGQSRANKAELFNDISSGEIGPSNCFTDSWICLGFAGDPRSAGGRFYRSEENHSRTASVGGGCAPESKCPRTIKLCPNRSNMTCSFTLCPSARLGRCRALTRKRKRHDEPD